MRITVGFQPLKDNQTPRKPLEFASAEDAVRASGLSKEGEHAYFQADDQYRLSVEIERVLSRKVIADMNGRRSSVCFYAGSHTAP